MELEGSVGAGLGMCPEASTSSRGLPAGAASGSQQKSDRTDRSGISLGPRGLCC